MSLFDVAPRLALAAKQFRVERDLGPATHRTLRHRCGGTVDVFDARSASVARCRQCGEGYGTNRGPVTAVDGRLVA